MKHFLTTLLAAFVVLSANAGTLYCVGDGYVNGNKLKESPTNDAITVTSSNNVYTFKVKGCTWIQFSTAKATGWDATWNSGGLCKDNDGDYKLSSGDLGKEIYLYYGYGHNLTPPDTNEYEYTITLGNQYGSNSTLVVTKVTTTTPTYPTTVYLMGEVNGQTWDATKGIAQTGTNGIYTWTDVTMNADGSGTFSFATKLSSGSDPNWNQSGGVNSSTRYGAAKDNTSLTSGVASAVTEYSSNPGGCNSWQITPGATYDITLNLSTMKVTATKKADAPVTYPELYLLHTNSGKDWNWGNGISKTSTTGKYQWTGVNITAADDGKGCFVFSTINGSDWDASKSGFYGAQSENLYITSSGNVYKGNQWCWKVEPGIYTIDLDLTSDPNKVTITKTGEIAGPTGKYTWYLLGEFNNWGKEEKYACEKGTNGEGTFTWKLDKLPKGDFKFRAGNDGWYDFSKNNQGKYNGNLSEKLKNAGVKITQSKFDDNAHLNRDLTNVTITVHITNENGNVYMQYLEFDGTPGDPVESWVLRGQVSTNSDWNDYPFIQSDDDPNIWTLSIPGSSLSDNREFGLKMLVDDEYDDVNWYRQLNGTLSVGSTLTLSKKTDSNQNMKFDLDGSKIYTLTFNTHNKTLKVAECNTVYLYGHINGGSWDRGNFTELVYNPSTKYYEVNVAYIKGKWNEHDVSIDGNRKLWNSTDGKNFMAFYPQIQDNPNFNRKELGMMKLGSPDHENTTITLGEWHTYQLSNEKEDNNFMMANPDKPGVFYYKVEFDAKEKKARWTVTNETVEDGKIVKYYSWYSGDDSNAAKDEAKRRSVNADGYYTYSFLYGQDNRNVVQVALYSNPKHDAARQANYVVKKKGGKKKTEVSSKRQAVNEDDYGDPEDGDFRIEGSNGYDDNTLVHLYSVGEYLITATMEEDAVDENGNKISETYDVRPSSILVTVANAGLTLHVNGSTSADEDEPISVPFSADGISLDNIISFTTTGSTTGEDIGEEGTNFTVTITPVNSDSWVALPEGTSITDATAVDNAYWDALNVFELTEQDRTQNQTKPLQLAGLYNQYKSASANGTKLVDGFFTPWTSTAAGTSGTPAQGTFIVSKSTDAYSSTEYSINMAVPCSGLYSMVIQKEGSGYTFTSRTIEIEVYPNLLEDFNGEKGFNVDGYTFAEITGDDKADITYPIDRISYWNGIGEITQVHAYCPGTYFADKFEQSAASTSSTNNNGKLLSNKRQDAPTDSNVPEEAFNYITGVNLTSLVGKTSNAYEDLSMYVEKNGASHTYIFHVVLSDGNDFNTSTGVEAIGAEDGEAEYYNLQGVKVQNPERGIYIKVANGKSEKVVIK